MLETSHMYTMEYDFIDQNPYNINLKMLNNKLFATFSNLEGLDLVLEDIQRKYDIRYNKIFVLEVKHKDEFLITYNVDQTNLSSIPENTILVHRKKESNTLYTINALNGLITQLNGGTLDTRYRVNWQDYRNSILLTKHNELVMLDTKIYKIIEL